MLSTENGMGSVPVSIHRSNVLWYIPDNLDQWGVDVPATWDDFLAICPDLQARLAERAPRRRYQLAATDGSLSTP